MSSNYVIYTDVSTDVDPLFAKENDVRFISMHYTLGDENRLCEGIEPEDILSKFYDGQKNGDLTKTSQINPKNYEDAFRPVLEEGKSVLYICLSSGLSGTFQSANIAADTLADEYTDAKVIPVDSLAATGGMGLLVEAAVYNRAKGMSIEDNAKWLNDNVQRTNHWFMVDDLMYLKRGGRVSAATALVGTTLNIKPILTINPEGKLDTIDKKRGAKVALKTLIEDYKKSCTDPANEFENTIYINHGNAPERATQVKDELLKINPNLNIKVMMLSPIIGAHTGPGMVAVIHWGKER